MSRLRSGRAAKKSTPAPRGGGRQVMVPSARSDVYVSLLGVALAAILIGTLLMALVMRRYEFSIKAAGLTPAPASIALVA